MQELIEQIEEVAKPVPNGAQERLEDYAEIDKDLRQVEVILERTR